ncbi:xanthine dehydrogenase YagR molybdenum-binding subunit [Sphingobium xenophagum]|uniref:Xanthine dehydrogenase YagR molybdenum-binding subunit n=1 Tax=Sphingobium xenophagum TaxID=121428 RepID=A0ABU1X3V5_SPHXE|nr:xanthine dehydrogenase family protein molybdopterin-binding subunit [Sphingobium xenophagum]MDR7155717.1 xanthine dehydrogenase YagR molybdenum-binding subunit [Sphingobium xenophagum]
MSIINDAAEAAKSLAFKVMKKAVENAPDRWMPGGTPDPLIRRQHGQIGRPISRIDGPLKVEGSARFAAEVALDNMTYAAIAFSTIARGRIASLDVGDAEAAPGVVLVMSYRNAPRMKPMQALGSSEMALSGDDLPVMQDDVIHWNGQPVAVVLAETQEQADYARSLIRIGYEIWPSTTAFEVAKAAGTETGFFLGQPLHVKVGDAESALAAAPFRVDGLYRTPRHSHAAIEPHATTVAWNEDALVVHDATQGVTHTAWQLSRVFGIPQEKVHVTSPYVGGGFGSKGLWQHQVLGAAAAKLARRPVRITLSREGVFRIVGVRSPTEQRVAIGADERGCFTAIVHTGTALMTPHNFMPEPFIAGTGNSYAAETFKLDVQIARINSVASTFMRGPGEAVGTFALECAVDELAELIGLDPIELRIRNEPERNPTDGRPFSSRNIVEAYRAGAERFGWSTRQAPGTRREGEWLVGLGCATGTYPYYRMPGGVARLTIDRDGCVRASVAAHEMGMGTATAHTQVVADRMGLPLDKITVEYGDSILPGVFLAGGSQQTAAIGAAIIAAHRTLVAKLIRLAGNDSPIAGLRPDEVTGLDGGLAKLDDAERRESYASILARAKLPELTVEAKAPLPLEMLHWSMHSQAAMFCEARVNAVTGETRIARFLGSFDCGRIVNPKTAASQFRGGIIMGLGLALMEETAFDERTGRVMSPSLAEYHVPAHLDVPPIDVMWTDIPDPHTPMGARGIGEIGITGTGAAVANAIYNATGKRIRDLPITLDKLL